MSRHEAFGEGSPEAASLRRATLLAAILVAAVVGTLTVAVFLPRGEPVELLALPAALAGAVAPVIGFRLYRRLQQGVPAGAPREERCSAFVRATLIALAVTESSAMLGIVALLTSHRAEALIGVLTHVILTGVIWPTEERLAGFLGPR